MNNKLSELSKPSAEVVSKFGDPEAFGERELKVLADIQKLAYDTKFYSQEYVSALKDENEYLHWRIKEMDLLFGKNLLAMRAAVIEAEHGEGHSAGMQWIFNTLFGPGEFAPENETDAQDYYNREAEKIDAEFSKCMELYKQRRKSMKEQSNG